MRKILFYYLKCEQGRVKNDDDNDNKRVLSRNKWKK